MASSANVGEDLVQIALRELSVERKARDAGQLGHPPAESSSLDATHQEIVAYFSSELRKRRSQFENELNSLRADRQAASAKIDIDQARDRFSTLTNAITPEIQSLRQKHEQTVSRAKEEADDRALRNLRWYQREHGLRDDAQYPSSQIHHFAWVAIIAVLEWIGLSAFYAEGSDYGLLGGVLIAMALSIANISLAILFGSLLRYFNHKSTLRKGLALVGVLFLTSCFMVVTLGAAHYRVATNEIAASQLSTQSQSAERPSAPPLNLGESEQWRAAKLAGKHFAAQPLGFEDVFSWILIVLAIVFGIFATYKGYRIDDPYPGYGQRDRTYRLRSHQYEELKRAYVNDVEQFFARTLSEQRSLLSQIRRDVDIFQSKCAASQDKVQGYNGAAEEIIEDCNIVVKRYREENVKVAGLPRPSYFDRPVQLEARLLVSLKPLLTEETDLQRRYQQATREFSDLAQRNDKEVQDRRADELRRLDEFFRVLEQRVRDSLNQEAQTAPGSAR